MRRANALPWLLAGLLAFAFNARGASTPPTLFVAQQTGGRFGGSNWSRANNSPSAPSRSSVSASSSDDSSHTHSASSDHESDDGGGLLILVALVFSWFFVWSAKQHWLFGLAVFLVQTVVLQAYFAKAFPWQAMDFSEEEKEKPFAQRLPKEQAPTESVVGSFLSVLFSVLCFALAFRIHQHGSVFVARAYTPAIVIFLSCLGVSSLLIGIGALKTFTARNDETAERALRWWAWTQPFLVLFLLQALWSVLAITLIFSHERLS